MFALTDVLDVGRKNMDLVGAVMVGTATALGGGTARDLLPQPPVFWLGELYASAAWAGALAIIGLQALGLAPVVAAWAGMATILGIRLLAMAFRITLPTYSARK